MRYPPLKRLQKIVPEEQKHLIKEGYNDGLKYLEEVISHKEQLLSQASTFTKEYEERKKQLECFKQLKTLFSSNKEEWKHLLIVYILSKEADKDNILPCSDVLGLREIVSRNRPEIFKEIPDGWLTNTNEFSPYIAKLKEKKILIETDFEYPLPNSLVVGKRKLKLNDSVKLEEGKKISLDLLKRLFGSFEDGGQLNTKAVFGSDISNKLKGKEANIIEHKTTRLLAFSIEKGETSINLIKMQNYVFKMFVQYMKREFNPKEDQILTDTEESFHAQTQNTPARIEKIERQLTQALKSTPGKELEALSKEMRRRSRKYDGTLGNLCRFLNINYTIKKSN